MAGPSRALAAPSIEVKAQTQVVLEKVRALGDGEVEVRGSLVDRLTGTGLRQPARDRPPGRGR